MTPDTVKQLLRELKFDLAIYIDDTTTAGITYLGMAEIGTAAADNMWQIRTIDDTSGDTQILWADGNGRFDNVWDDRASLSYS